LRRRFVPEQREQSPDRQADWVPVAWTDANTVYHSLPGPFAPSTDYYFRVKAFTDSAESGYSNTDDVTTVAWPAAPTGLVATAVSTSRIDLEWTDNSSGADITLQRSADGVYWSNVTITDNESASDTGLTEGATYHYRVFAHSGAGESGYSTNSETVLSIAPAAIDDLAASAPMANSITLTWTAPGDDGMIGTAAAYDIRYSTSPIDESNWEGAAQVSDVPAPRAGGTADESMVITGLDPNTEYFFAIRALDEVGNAGELSNVVAAGTLTVFAGWDLWLDEGDELTLLATVLNDGGQTPAYAWVVRDAAQQVIASGGDLDLTFTVLDDGVYTATFTATDSVDGEASDSILITALNLRPTLTVTGEARVDEGGQYSLMLGYQDVGDDGLILWTVDWGDNTSNSQTSDNPATLVHTFFGPSAVNDLKITAQDDDGTYILRRLVTVIPAAPGSLTATAFSNRRIDVAWSDNSAVETGYVIERQEDGGDFEPVAYAEANDTEYSDTDVYPGTTYAYRVKAMGVDGDSVWSSASAGVDPASAVVLTIASIVSAPSEYDSYRLSLQVSGFEGTAKCLIDWGDGTVSAAGAGYVEHRYVSDGQYTVEARMDIGGDVRSNQLAVSVADTPLQPGVWGAYPTVYQPFTLYLHAFDYGLEDLDDQDTWWWEIDWGDGTSSTAPLSAYTTTHEYQSAGAVPDPCVARVRYRDGQTVSDLWTSDPMYVIVNGPINTVTYPAYLEARLASASTGNELRWSESSSVETGFSILRCSSEYGDYDVVGWVGPKTTSYLDATAPTNEVNWYKVREEGPGGPLYSDPVSMARPLVSVTALMSALSETPGDFGAFRFTRDDWYPNYETAVRFTLAGEATAGVDYELIGPDGQVIEDGVVTIPAKRDSVDVIVRAIADNVSELNERIVLTLTAGAADGYRLGFWAEAMLTIHETPDLIDIDSDNTNGFDDPDGTPEEDRIEDDATKPGKILAVNDNDDDGDGIPDYADGFDWDGITSEDDRAAFDDPNTPEHEPQEQFVPVILVLPEGVNPSVAKVKLTYSASDPANVGRTGEGTPEDPYVYTPAAGALRLWTKDGSAARDKASLATGGDFVPSDVELSWSALPDGPTADTKRLWLEAISVGGFQITVDLDPDGIGPQEYTARDTVRVTSLGGDLDIDSDNTSNSEPERDVHEDLIEADPALAGKLIVVNDADKDADGVPDFADGYIGSPGDTLPDQSFIPLILSVPNGVNLTTARFYLHYEGSDPAQIESVGTVNRGFAPAPGYLRIWKHAGGARSRLGLQAGGDYVVPQEGYTASQLGVAGETRKTTLYVEAVRPSAGLGDLSITLWVSPDGLAAPLPVDTVRLTAVEAYHPDADRSGAVRLADGAVILSATDIASNGFGGPFGFSRTYSTAFAASLHGFTGNGFVSSLPHLIQATSSILFINGDVIRCFDQTANGSATYQARFDELGNFQRLADGTYKLTEADGGIWTFNSTASTIPGIKRGSLMNFVDADGNTVTASYDGTSGLPTTVVRSRNDVTETWTYSFNTVPAGERPQLKTITLSLSGAGDQSGDVRRAKYTYYDGDAGPGKAGDLRKVEIGLVDGTDGVIPIDTYYYLPIRYFGRWREQAEPCDRPGRLRAPRGR
jgi:hypothetical protein